MKNIEKISGGLGTLFRYRMVAIASIITPTISIIQTAIIVRIVPQVDYGQYLAITMVSGFFLNLLDMNSSKTFLWLGAKAYAEKDKEKFSTLFIASIIVETISYLLIFGFLMLAGEHIVHFFKNAQIPVHQYRIFLLTLIAAIGRGTFSIVPLILSAIRFQSLLEIILSIIKFLVTLFLLVVIDPSVNGLVYAALISTVLCTGVTIFSIVCFMRKRKMLTRPKWASFNIRQFMHYSIQSYSLISLKALSSRFSQLIAAYYLSPEQISVFGIADTAFQMVRSLFSRIGNFWQSSFAAMVHNKQYKALHNKIREGTLWSGAIWLCVLLVLISGGKIIIQMIFGSQYADMYPIAIVLCLGYTLVSPLFWMSPLSIAFDRPGLLTFGKVLQIIFGSITAVIFTSWFGAIGTALGQSIGRITSETIVLKRIRSIYKDISDTDIQLLFKGGIDLS